MSSKRRNNPITSSQSQKIKQQDGVTKSEVINKNKSQDSSNRSNFANIAHKNSHGATNWAKFTELSLQKVDLSSKKPSTNRPTNQVQTVNMLSHDKRNHNPKLFNNNTSSFPRPPNNQSQINSKASTEGTSKIKVSKCLQRQDLNAIKSMSDIPKPILTKHIAMDCEMVGVEIGVSKNMLARISLVNSHGDCIYDKFIKPTEAVLDYRTRISGVRPIDLETADDFKTVQKEVSDILKGRILVGHALKNDLRVLYLSHPRHSIRDTSRFPKFREGRTPALKKLAKKFLGVTIQEGEHSSVQDALAAMQLYKMFKKEWESSIYSKKRQVKTAEKSKLLS